MHIDNRYNNHPPNFAHLASKHEALRPYVQLTPNGGGILDFQDPEALRALTSTLLANDFGLEVELREDRLCPTVANRLDYVHTVLDLLAQLTTHDDRPPRVFDIGTGHAAIYPLLLHALRPDLKVQASELNLDSLAHARRVVAANGDAASEAITLLPACNNGTLLDHLLHAEEPYANDVTMCNPPFYGSAQEAAALSAAKELPASNAPTGASHEEITPGGEEAFIGQMIDESAECKTISRWYTSLVGKYASLEPLVARIRAVTDNYTVVRMQQARTARWVLIWGFSDERISQRIIAAHGSATLGPPTNRFKALLPPSTYWSLTPSPPVPWPVLHRQIVALLYDLGMLGQYRYTPNEVVLYVRPHTVAWSRYERRVRESAVLGAEQQKAADESAVDEVLDWDEEPAASKKGTTAGELPPLFEARFKVVRHRPDDDDGGGEGTSSLEMMWDKGTDRKVVDAFWKWVVARTVGKRSG